VLISVAVSTSTKDAGAAGVAARFFDVLFPLERREVRELERRLGFLARGLLFTEDLFDERRLGVLERLRFEEDLFRLLRRLALLEALGVLERRLLRLAEDLLLRRLPRLGALRARRFFELLGVRARRLLLFERRRDREVEGLIEAERDRLRLGAFGVLARRAERRRLEPERDMEADREDERRLDPLAARRFFEPLGVRVRRLLLFERRRDRDLEALIEAERDRLRLGAFGVLARRAERRRFELEGRDVEADREDERRLDPSAARRLFELVGVRARRLLLFERRRDREVEALIEAERDRLRLGAFGVFARRAKRRRLELERRDVEAEREDERRLDPFGDLARRLRFGVRALREELRRAFLRF